MQLSSHDRCSASYTHTLHKALAAASWAYATASKFSLAAEYSARDVPLCRSTRAMVRPVLQTGKQQCRFGCVEQAGPMAREIDL